MEGDYSRNGHKKIVEGIEVETLCKDGEMLMSQFMLKKGSCLPLHSHPGVHSGYLLKGKMKLHINGEVRELLPGNSWCIQNDLQHWAEILEDLVAIEVFHPEKENDSPYEVEQVS